MRNRLLSALVFLLCACGDDDPASDAAVHDASIDAATACVGSAPFDCEEVVATEDQCPSEAEVCGAGTCGGAYKCCYCAPVFPGEAADWQTLYTECGPCTVDAGAD